MTVFEGMVGATITGIVTAILGVPGLVVGLIVAYVYYGRRSKS